MTFSTSLLTLAFCAVAGLAACSSASEPGPEGDALPSPGAPTATAPGQQPPQAPPSTPAPATGTPKRTPIGKYVVKDCDGNDYALESAYGASATWLFVAHGWCPYCRSATKQAEAVLASYAGKNVAAVNVLVENAQSQPPTITDCKAWRDTHQLTNVIALYDPAGVTKELFDAGSSALSVFIDKDRVIRSKIIHTDDVTAIKAGIDAALLPP
jgi:hypothetical protein